MSIHLARLTLALGIVVAAVGTAVPAFAGPPLLCHPYDIGAARSLPWSGGVWGAEPNYDVTHLTADTVALLTPSTQVVVRMETLRRAAIYATRDRAVAADLLGTLTARTRGGAAGPDALAWLDAAYITEAFRQARYLGQSSVAGQHAAEIAALVTDVNGRTMIEKALVLRPGDPGLEFAAALINAEGDRIAYHEHAQRARTGATKDELVARNIALLQD